MWAAIDLSDQQTFFGHIRSSTGPYVDVTNVAYVDQPSQPPQSLVRDQIQCPTDEIRIAHAAVTKVISIADDSPLARTLAALDREPKTCFQPPSSPAP